ncbi:MAG: AAA family ATPase [Geobacteraceae bacterium]|nr:MAG: AAA family ATPase [Geobacteraceae bacterium]
MYLDYYELKKFPFRTNPDPQFLWLGEKHKRALSFLENGTLKRDGFLLLTGDVGTGKTSLIRYFLRSTDASAIIAAISNPMMPALDFYNFLSEKFKLDNKLSDKADFFIHLKKFLLKAYSEHKLVFVIIDAAQTLDHERLEEIRLLSNIEFENQKLLNIFFVGQNETETILMDPRNKATSQRINMSYQLQNLDEQETIHYIAHRLKVAGANRGIFTDDACKKIFDIADGIPRLINSICDCALLSGYVEGRKIIDPIWIRECQIELRIPIGTIFI